MKIAILLNISNFMSTVPDELRRRGHEAELYSPRTPYLDPIGYEIPKYNGSMVDYGIKVARWKFHCRMNRYFDFVLNNTYPRNPFSHSPEIMNWQGCEVFLDEIKNPGYYCTPDIAKALPAGSILLPRAVNAGIFHGLRNQFNKYAGEDRKIRIGHFWKRGNVAGAYLNRYWKKTDLLMDAIRDLRYRGYEVELVEGPVPREKMPETLASLDVLAEEFGCLSHGITAVESLIAGTPVVGSYDPDLCESKDTLDMLINVEPEPLSISSGIIRSLDRKVGSTRAVEEYFSARHTVDVLEETWKKLV